MTSPIRLTVALCLAACLLAADALAHEGHQPLPSKGVQVDVERGHVTLSKQARDILDIQSVEIGPGTIASRIYAYTTVVTPWRRRANVSTRLAGKVTALHVVPGDKVQAGQRLVELDSVAFQTLRADYQKTLSELELARTVLKALAPAGAGGAVSGQRVVEAQTAVKQSEIALEVLKAKAAGLHIAADQLEQSDDAGFHVPAASPIKGVVVHSDVAVGRLVEPTDHLLEIVDPRHVWVEIPLLERDIHRVREGQQVLLRFAALGAKEFSARISRIGRLLDPQTHQVSVWADLDVEPGTTGPVAGMSGTAQIVSSLAADALTVPSAAIFSDGADRYVFVEEASTREGAEYRKRSVVLGRRSADVAEVVGGEVYPGDRIVVRGGHELSSLFFLGVLKPGAATAKAIGLKLEALTDRPIEEVIHVDGSVEIAPQDRIEVSAQISGVLSRIHVDRAQEVAAGDPLIEITSLELQDVQLDLIQAKLSLDSWSDLYARRKEAGEGVSPRVLAETEKQVLGATGRVAALRDKLLTIGLGASELDQILASRRVAESLTIRAPFAGSVVRFDGVLGQTWPANSPMLEIHRLTRPRVQVFLPERLAAKVAIGQHARVRLSAYPDRQFDGKVARIGPSQIAGSRTLAAWIELDAPSEPLLLHNMLARAVIRIATPPPVLGVPKSAIVQDGLQTFVFVRKSDGTFERRRVQVGTSDDRFVEIRQGAARGESIAVGGVPQLQTAYASVR
ncbi:efflux RND transporter periplasmic adaptor subunit [Planctomyces sp. SH-PL14]|uniref:efflux RND transporter periplasmic adaptor subunit n=1 Tax=Planctomyces sp. SH-PL14 TaxID=1632864 RepID=UPI00078CF5F2|nr:efflux RND transporter periplasmic adaptor subunit [Planctomyces sp. SH-PL14]AMV22627.1 Cation efflux system protein CusB precursor [Planctomyces sp. SH-PL14]